MLLETFISHLEAVLPMETAMQGDRLGLQLQSGRETISRVLVSMEVTDAVVAEAIEKRADCILSFHPLIFAPLQSLRETERVGRLCTALIRHSIALVVAHTNFDSFPKGTSAILAERLGLRVESVLIPDAKHAGFGMGVLAFPEKALSENELLERVASVCHSPLRFTRGKAARYEKIAIVGGSGVSFLSDVLRSHADAFITADVKYHDFHRVSGILTLIDPGHYEMEQFVAQGLLAVVEAIQARCSGDSTLETFTAESLPNPVRYFPQTELYEQQQKQFLLV